MMFGPFALIPVTASIVSNGGGWITGANFAFFLVLGAMCFGRWLEFRGGNPQTVDGAPATPDHLRRYMLVTGLAGLVVWAAANLAAGRWSPG
jgi:hypothetical protein